MLFSGFTDMWDDYQTYAVFSTAAKTGMRCGEVLALSWSVVDLASGSISIHQAWKDNHELGLPKWDKIRAIPVVDSIVEGPPEL